jgi:hypothetical protein
VTERSGSLKAAGVTSSWTSPERRAWWVQLAMGKTQAESEDRPSRAICVVAWEKETQELCRQAARDGGEAPRDWEMRERVPDLHDGARPRRYDRAASGQTKITLTSEAAAPAVVVAAVAAHWRARHRIGDIE